jgi:hypothetical protein
MEFSMRPVLILLINIIFCSPGTNPLAADPLKCPSLEDLNKNPAWVEHTINNSHGTSIQEKAAILGSLLKEVIERHLSLPLRAMETDPTRKSVAVGLLSISDDYGPADYTLVTVERTGATVEDSRKNPGCFVVGTVAFYVESSWPPSTNYFEKITAETTGVLSERETISKRLLFELRWFDPKDNRRHRWFDERRNKALGSQNPEVSPLSIPSLVINSLL